MELYMMVSLKSKSHRFLAKVIKIMSGCPNSSPVPIYVPGLGEVLCELSAQEHNTCSAPEPGPLDPKSNPLTAQ